MAPAAKAVSKVTKPAAEFNNSVDKGVAVPPQTGGPRTSKYRELAAAFKAGDSKLMPTKSSASNLRSQLRKCGFKTARRDEGDGFRVWATKKIEE